jgi:Ni,Fe-hydrogenase I large subunit
MSDWASQAETALSRDHLASLATLMSEARQACFQKGDSFTLRPEIKFDVAVIESIIQRINKLCHEKIFGVTPVEWYELDDLQGFNRWIDQTDTLATGLLRELRDHNQTDAGDWGVEPLPQLDHQQLCQRLSKADADKFIAAPDWQGQIHETGPLTRLQSHPLLQQLKQRYGSGVMPRLVARLLELASMPGALSQQLSALKGSGEGVEKCHQSNITQQGVGEVEAARGRLFHRVVQQDGTIRQYQIVAPTEWNFHPQGVVYQGLKRLSAKHETQLRQQAERVIGAVDPCVGFQLELV